MNGGKDRRGKRMKGQKEERIGGGKCGKHERRRRAERLEIRRDLYTVKYCWTATLGCSEI